jgi:hypothetical protein
MLPRLWEPKRASECRGKRAQDIVQQQKHMMLNEPRACAHAVMTRNNYTLEVGLLLSASRLVSLLPSRASMWLGSLPGRQAGRRAGRQAGAQAAC